MSMYDRIFNTITPVNPPATNPAAAGYPESHQSGGQTLGNPAKPAKTPAKRRFSKKDLLDDGGLDGVVGYRRGESHVADVKLQRLARKIKLFAIKFALYTNGRSFDVIDDRLLDDGHLNAFVSSIKTESVRSEQFEMLMGVFKEQAFGAIHICLGYLESSEYQVETNRRLMSMSLQSWFNNAKIANNLAQAAAFYAINPKYMNTSKWPRKEIIAQWQNSNHETMDFFLNYDTYA